MHAPFPFGRLVQQVPFDPTQSSFRWRMLALVWLVYFCFGMTVGSIPPLVGPIIDDLHMTNGQMGLVLGAWQLVFIGTAPPLGRLVDRIGERRAITIGLAVMLLSLVLRGLATNFYTLLAAVALFGAGGPIISVGIPKVVALWFGGRERGPVAGAYVIGRDAGSVLALATAASLVISLTGSWRGISLMYSAVLLLVLVLWVVFARNAGVDGVPTPARPAAAPEPQPTDARTELADTPLLRIRNVQVVLALGFTTFFLNHGLTTWLPTLLHEGGMSLGESGRWVAVSLVVGMAAHIALPSLARFGRRRLAMGLMLAVAAATTAALAFLTGAPLVAVLFVGTMARFPTIQILTLVLIDTPGVGARRIGAAAGLFFAVAEIGGFAGPLMMGVVRDLTDDLSAGVMALAVVTAVLAMLALFIREERPEQQQ